MSVPGDKEKIEGSWIEGGDIILKVSDEEWKAAHGAVQEKIKSGVPLPFKVSRKNIGTDHSFLAIPAGDGGFEIMAMARGKSYKNKAGITVNEGIRGHGSFGQVKIVQRKDNTQYALKIQPEDAKTSEEDAILKKLGTLKTVFVRERNAGTPWIEGQKIKNKKYILQELQKGEPLDKYLRDYTDKRHYTPKKEMPLGKRIDVAISSALTVEHLHNQRIIHGDIKPENFLLNFTKNNAEMTMIDFGLSHVLPDNASSVIVKQNKVEQYTAPEVYKEGRYSTKSDVYALGKMFKDDLRISLSQSKELEALITKMTSADPNDRPEITAVIQELRTLEVSLKKIAEDIKTVDDPDNSVPASIECYGYSNLQPLSQEVQRFYDFTEGMKKLISSIPPVGQKALEAFFTQYSDIVKDSYADIPSRWLNIALKKKPVDSETIIFLLEKFDLLSDYLNYVQESLDFSFFETVRKLIGEKGEKALTEFKENIKKDQKFFLKALELNLKDAILLSYSKENFDFVMGQTQTPMQSFFEINSYEQNTPYGRRLEKMFEILKPMLEIPVIRNDLLGQLKGQLKEMSGYQKGNFLEWARQNGCLKDVSIEKLLSKSELLEYLERAGGYLREEIIENLLIHSSDKNETLLILARLNLKNRITLVKMMPQKLSIKKLLSESELFEYVNASLKDKYVSCPWGYILENLSIHSDDKNKTFSILAGLDLKHKIDLLSWAAQVQYKQLHIEQLFKSEVELVKFLIEIVKQDSLEHRRMLAFMFENKTIKEQAAKLLSHVIDSKIDDIVLFSANVWYIQILLEKGASIPEKGRGEWPILPAILSQHKSKIDLVAKYTLKALVTSLETLLAKGDTVSAQKLIRQYLSQTELLHIDIPITEALKIHDIEGIISAAAKENVNEEVTTLKKICEDNFNKEAKDIDEKKLSLLAKSVEEMITSQFQQHRDLTKLENALKLSGSINALKRYQEARGNVIFSILKQCSEQNRLCDKKYHRQLYIELTRNPALLKKTFELKILNFDDLAKYNSLTSSIFGLAVQAGDCKLIKSIFEGLSVKEKETFFAKCRLPCPVTVAIGNNDAEMVKLFLDNGANPVYGMGVSVVTLLQCAKYAPALQNLIEQYVLSQDKHARERIENKTKFFLQRLGHTVGLTQVKTLDGIINTEGSRDADSVPIMRELLGEYTKIAPGTNKTFFEKIEQGFSLAEDELLKINNNNVTDFMKAYTEDCFLVLPSSFHAGFLDGGGHAICFVLKKIGNESFISITNRGFGQERYGNKIFKIRPDADVAYFIEHVALNSFKSGSEIDKCISEIIEQPPIEIIEQKNQKRGTCGIANRKGAVEAALYLLEYEQKLLELQKRQPDAKVQEEAMAQIRQNIKKEAKESYKKFTNFIRDHEINNILKKLKTKDKKDEIDPEIYYAVLVQYIREHPQFEKKKGNQGRRLIQIWGVLPQNHKDSILKEIPKFESDKTNFVDNIINKITRKEKADEVDPRIYNAVLIEYIRTHYESIEKGTRERCKQIWDILPPNYKNAIDKEIPGFGGKIQFSKPRIPRLKKSMTFIFRPIPTVLPPADPTVNAEKTPGKPILPPKQ